MLRTSNQHVEMGRSRKKHDVQDLLCAAILQHFNKFSNISNEVVFLVVLYVKKIM